MNLGKLLAEAGEKNRRGAQTRPFCFNMKKLA
jgi:hypothetical protein